MAGIVDVYCWRRVELQLKANFERSTGEVEVGGRRWKYMRFWLKVFCCQRPEARGLDSDDDGGRFDFYLTSAAISAGDFNLLVIEPWRR